MEPLVDSEIREQLARYLADETSLHDFEEWLVAHTWNLHQIADPLVRDLVAEIELRLAEFSNGDWTDAELRDLLKPLVQKYAVHFGSREPGTRWSGIIIQPSDEQHL
ncbi:MAG: hypothetical protein HY690_18410 [Chloroflexi bacterium]|nr:hypothetical protein [Chloroflexota bacterium]